MVEKEISKEVEVKSETDGENLENEPKVTKKNLMQIAEVRMVLYVVPAAIIIWIFSYFWQHYVQNHFLDLFH
jgi:cell division protein FtsL